MINKQDSYSTFIFNLTLCNECFPISLNITQKHDFFNGCIFHCVNFL